MPNWCDNTLEITHADPAMIERAKTAFQEHRLLNEFVPVPQELKDTTSGYMGKETYAQELLEATEQLNLKWFKHKNWYDFCIGEWGTKWDVGGDEGVIAKTDTNYLCLSFQSAWSPPTNAYYKLRELGFEVRAYYFEPGMGFCGYWEDGFDDEYSLDGNSEWVRENIPSAIDEMFGISANMEEWELENAEDEEEEV
jgi:hypothetical protein